MILLASFRNVNEKGLSEILCNQMDRKLLIPIVEGDKVVSLKYQSLDLQQNCDTESKLEIQKLHEQEVFDSVVG